MPRKQFPVHLVPSTLDHISMARYNLIKVPPVNLPCTRIESFSISATCHIPQESFLPCCGANGTLESGEKLGQHPIRRFLSRPTILLVRRQIEHHVRLDERPIRPMAKHQLFIRMTAYILIIKLLIKIRIHLHDLFILHGPNMCELCAGGLGVRFAFFREAFDAEDFGGREGAYPFREEDVVFEVHGGYVTDVVAESFHGGADFGSESCGREDSKGSGMEAHWLGCQRCLNMEGKRSQYLLCLVHRL